MRTPSNPTPGTPAIVLQFVLLTGTLCGMAASFFQRQQPLLSIITASNTATPLKHSPQNKTPQKEIITLYSTHYVSPGGKYRVEVEDFQGSNTGLAYDTRNANLRLRVENTGKTLWETTVFCSSNTDVFWSEDGSAVAVFDNAGIPNRLLIWRKGERLYDIKGGDALDCEGVFKMLWSPDKRGILMRTARAMGSYDSDLGDLWYIQLPSCRILSLSYGDGVRQMEWLSNRKVRYKTIQYNHAPDGETLNWRFHTHQQTLR